VTVVSDDVFEILIYALLLGSLLGFLGWFFARYVIGRRRIASGNRALGIVNFEYLQSADGKRAVQEIMFTQEAWEERHEDGDPPDPGTG
jgi:hypothetical protein